MDALRPDVDVDTLILGTDVDGLQILPAGTGSEHATELLASERMDKLILDLLTFSRVGRLKTTHKIVQLDTTLDAALTNLASNLTTRGAHI